MKTMPKPAGETGTTSTMTTTLLHSLREAGDSSVKLGCEEGHCGACMVLVAGKPRYACLSLPPADGELVETARSLTQSGDGERVAKALSDAGAVQCGYCTPGIVVTLTHLVRQGTLDEERVKQALEAHHCRCTGYYAFLRAARQLGQSQLDNQGQNT